MGRRRKGELPGYRRHKGNGQAYVTLPGCKPTYLGVYGSPESKRLYRKLIAPLDQGPVPPPTVGGSVMELVAAHRDWARRHYRRADGTATTEAQEFRRALEPVLALFGGLDADEFRPKHLKAVRQAYIDAGLSLGVVNQRVGRVRRVFRWGAGEDAVDPATVLALEQVADLPTGRGYARETAEVLPVEWVAVKQTLPHLASRQLRALVLFQWWAGCRPGEACAVRGADLYREGWVQLGQRRIKLPPGVWAYVVRAKMAHAREQVEQVYALGPKAQAALRPWLRPDPEEHLFQPREAQAERYRAMRAARKSKVQPSQVNRSLPVAKWRPGDCYLPTSYTHGVTKACERAGIEPWAPNQIRHAFECRVEYKKGIDAARAAMGHTSVNTTKLYGTRDVLKAAEVAQSMG